MDDALRALIAGVAAGAADGVAALRDRGLVAQLDRYSVEAVLDGEDRAPSASVRLDFVMARPDADQTSWGSEPRSARR